MESDDLRTRLRRRLSTAVRAQDRPAVSALRSALAALDNAEAVQPGEGFQPEVSQHVAGGVAGLGAAEVERQVLDAESRKGDRESGNRVNAYRRHDVRAARTERPRSRAPVGSRGIGRGTRLDHLNRWAYLEEPSGFPNRCDWMRSAPRTPLARALIVLMAVDVDHVAVWRSNEESP